MPDACVPQGLEQGSDGGLTPGDGGKSLDASRATDARKDTKTGPSPREDAEPATEPAPDASGTEEEPGPPIDPGEAGACADGFATIGDKCTCDLRGTFALRGKVPVDIAGQNGVEDGSDTAELWAIVQPGYEGDESLTLTVTDCGYTIPEICGAGSLLLAAEAYAQYTPAKVWKQATPASSSSSSVEMERPDALPNTMFISPPFALLRGVALEDPLGEWPGARKDIEDGPEFDGSAVNGARWLDQDEDDELGVTSFVVPPGGVSAGNSGTAPSASYSSTSTTCPRSDPAAARSPYGYLPVPEGLSVRRIKRIYQATRITASLSGRIESCDRVSGELQGPNDGAVRLEMRIGGCTIASGSSEAECEPALLDLAEGSDALTGGLIGQPATFVMKRVADDVNCADVRKTDFES